MRRAQTPVKTGELALIERIRQRAARNGATAAVRVGIGDDCAVLAPPPGHEVLVTTDFSLEGRHFRRDWHPAAAIGHRALARGLSDLAAMGADPMAAFLSLALPRAVAQNTAWVDKFLDGLLTLAAVHKVALAGGDTAEAPGDAVLIDIILLGSAPAGTALLRSGARPGDGIYVTGRLGGAAQELRRLVAAPQRFSRAAAADGDHPHLFPQPRLAAGRVLRARGLATACIDLSDGLSTDLRHLCLASGVRAELLADALPVAKNLRGADIATIWQSLTSGGEDYELLFTARPATLIPKTLAGVKVTRIGTILKATMRAPTIVTVAPGGARTDLPAAGWEHLL